MQFYSLHMQLTDIRAAFTAAGRGAGELSGEQVAQMAAQQGERCQPVRWPRKMIKSAHYMMPRVLHEETARCTF
jgi:hypothetical protein